MAAHGVLVAGGLVVHDAEGVDNGRGLPAIEPILLSVVAVAHGLGGLGDRGVQHPDKFIPLRRSDSRAPVPNLEGRAPRVFSHPLPHGVDLGDEGGVLEQLEDEVHSLVSILL